MIDKQYDMIDVSLSICEEHLQEAMTRIVKLEIEKELFRAALFEILNELDYIKTNLEMSTASPFMERVFENKIYPLLHKFRPLLKEWEAK